MGVSFSPEQKRICTEIIANEASEIARIRVVRERLGLDLVDAKRIIEWVRTGRDLSEVQGEYVDALGEILDDDHES